MSRYGARALLVVAATSNAACGVIFQHAVGDTHREVRVAEREREVVLPETAPGVRIERLETDGSATPVAGVDRITYAVHETVQTPKSLVPSYIGVALDAAGVVGCLWLMQQVDFYGEYCLATFATSLIADGAFAAVRSFDRSERVVAYEPAALHPVTYRLLDGGFEQFATIDVARAHEVVFDGPKLPIADAAPTPGGPRYAAPPYLPHPVPPTPVIEPPEEQWYGWLTLPVDVAALIAMYYGQATDRHELALAGGAIHILGAPVLHGLRGEPANMGASFALRASALPAGAALGTLAALLVHPFLLLFGDFDLGDSIQRGAIFGATLTVTMTAPLVALSDILWLAWEPKDRDEAPEFRIVPTTGRTEDGTTTFGIAATF